MENNVLFANTDVEIEYNRPLNYSLEKSWLRHPFCLQLQFLPLLYGEPEDIVAVSAMPSHEYIEELEKNEWIQSIPKMALIHEIDSFLHKTCLSWGPSQFIQHWAQLRQMTYPIPKDWDLIYQVNSKAFSFRYNCLPQAALIYNQKELVHWFSLFPGKKILKSCYGFSGRGNRYTSDSSPSIELLQFGAKEWQYQRPIIAEPWVERLYDFSTQWHIHSEKQIDYVGATLFSTDVSGNYQGTIAGPETLVFGSLEPFLKQHREVAKRALKEIATMGFFGPIGIDALLYRDPVTQETCLYPIVEMNARQTMSLIALKIQKRMCPEKSLHMGFQSQSSDSSSLLPCSLVNAKGRVIQFSRQLCVKTL